MKRKRQIDLGRFCAEFPTVLLLIAIFLSVPTTVRAGEDADFRKAQGYYTLQEYKLAVDAFKAYLAANPKAERADQAALLLAESHFQLKQYAEAAAGYDAFLSAYPTSTRRPDALLRAIRIHFLLKKHPASLAAAETFLKENRSKVGKPDAHPELPKQLATALYFAGECQYGLKKLPEAQAYWEELIKSYPDSKLIADASEGLGWIYFDKKQYDAALERFRVTAAAPQHPRAGWALLMQGRTLAALKKYPDALDAFKAAPALQPGAKEIEQEAQLRTAETLLAAGEPAKATAAYQALAKNSPDAPATPLAIAAATYQFFDAKQYKEAVLTADAYLSLKHNAERAAVLRVKARSALAGGNTAEAAEIAKQAVTEAAAITDATRKPEEHGAALLLLAELSGKGGTAFYETAAKEYPTTRFGLSARYELARLAAQENQTDVALQHITALLEALKTGGDAASPGLKQDALFAAGEFTFRKGDYKRAEEFLKQYVAGAAENDPRGDDIARKQAWSRHEQKDDAEAAKILDAALAKYPKSALRDEMLYLRAITAAKLNDEKGAAQFGDEMLKAFPDSPFADDVLYERAAAQFKKGALNETIADLTQLLGEKYKASPLRPAALQLRATAYLQAGKTAEAAADADVALKGAVEKSPALELLRALALSAQSGKETEATEALSKLIAAAPNSVEGKQALLRRAYLYFGAKNFAKAKEDFNAYLKVDPQAGPERLEAEIRLAVCMRELKETAEAKTLLERLAANNPQLNRYGFEINSQLGNLQFEAKEYAKAMDSYTVAMNCAEKTPAVEIPTAAQAATALNLAWCQRYLKQNDAAEKSFATVLKHTPEGPFAAEALLERGRILDEAGKTDEALKTWTLLLEKKADSEQAPRAMLLKAQRLAKLAKFTDATPLFEQFVAKHAGDKSAREAWSGLAECQLQQGNAAGASEAFLKVLGEKGLDAEMDEPGERAMLGLAELNLRKGDALNAKKLALRILTERPGSAWTDAALFTAGQASETLGEPERAIGYFRKVIADFPQSAQVGAAKERLKVLGAGEK